MCVHSSIKMLQRQLSAVTTLYSSSLRTLRILFLFFSSLFVFLGLHLRHMKVPRLGLNPSYSLLPTPELQQLGIQAAPVTYTTAQGNTISLTH